MSFFRIRHSLDIKITGAYSQFKEIIYTGRVYDNPKFVNNVRFTYIDFIPEVPSVILNSAAHQTDLMEEIPTAPFNLLISERLKTKLEIYRKGDIQFFRSNVFQNGIEYSNYWFLNMYKINNEFIDYKNSIINWEKKNDDYETTYATTPVDLKFLSYEEYNIKKQKAKTKFETFNIKKLILQNVKEDFFLLTDIEGGAGFFVSERLKKEIENSEYTGVEFQPSELSYNEWMRPGGERERVYGKSW